MPFDALFKCMLLSMGLTCYVTADGTDYQLSDQKILQTDTGVSILGTVNVQSVSIATRFFCMYGDDVILDVPLMHQISGLSYVSVSISLSANYNRPVSIAPVDSCATVSDCEITVDSTATGRCRLLLIAPNGATISADRKLSLVFVDGSALQDRIYVGPGIHVLEFTSATSGIPLEEIYQISVGGYMFKIRHKFLAWLIL